MDATLKVPTMPNLLSILNCPGPQRLNLLLWASIWIWYFILKQINHYKLEINSVLSFKHHNDMQKSITTTQLEKRVKQFAIHATKFFIPLHLLILYIFIISSDLDEKSMTVFLFIKHSLPLLQCVSLITIILKNSEIIDYVAKRLPLIEPTPLSVRNVYILLSDSLTSFNRPLIEFTLFTSSLLGKPMTDLDLFLSSIPSLIRIFQCLREYKLVQSKSHLANALKYTCNLPILAVTWYSRVHPNIIANSKLFQMIQIGSLFLNSTYSFYWDVRMDWQLPSIFHIRYDNKKIVFEKYIYQIAIFIDFIIRYWWIWLLTFDNLHLNFILFDGELQYLEVLRRAQWVIFKLETEYISNPTIKS